MKFPAGLFITLLSIICLGCSDDKDEVVDIITPSILSASKLAYRFDEHEVSIDKYGFEVFY